jgi:hypothetical protein
LLLRGLLKREIEVEPLPETAAQSAAQPPRPQLTPISTADASPNPSPGRSPKGSVKASPKRRAKSLPIALLYPESEPEPQSQAEALLHEIQTYAEDTIGKYVPQSHLERFYGELCKERGWERKHWCVIGSELGKLTDRVLKKRGTKRFMVYKIPRACA